MTVGILTLQGAVQEHERALNRLGVEHRQVRLPGDLEGLDGLILPGGESTSMGRYLKAYGLVPAIRARAAAGLALFGLCAGAILLAHEVDGRPGLLDLLPVEVHRNAYGRQLSSFEEELDTPWGAFPGIFIRAPRFEALPGAEILVRRDPERGGEAVLIRSGRVLGGSFHPELAGDDRIHAYFLELAGTAP